jgi:hypothetical protein
MRAFLLACLLWAVCGSARGDDPCTGLVAAAILSHDRALRQGAGLWFNHCGREVRAEIVVVAHNQDGYPVARLRTVVRADARPLSVLRVDLPFVQSAIRLSGYSTEIATVESFDQIALGARPTRR